MKKKNQRKYLELRMRKVKEEKRNSNWNGRKQAKCSYINNIYYIIMPIYKINELKQKQYEIKMIQLIIFFSFNERILNALVFF